MEGVINVYKEAHWTSSDVVNKLKGVLHERRIGHGGTLDPDATGVLPICVGRATRLFDYITAFHKTYVACVKLGVVTDTEDATGNVLEENAVNVSLDGIKNILPEFIGIIKQIPPMYSALHINGERLYALARRGEKIELEAREIEIENVELISDLKDNEFSIRVTCGKGTYIRTLCHDIGKRLGCGAHMKTLLREKAAGLSLKDSYKISELQEMMDKGDLSFLKPTDQAVSFMERVNIHKNALKKLENGNPIPKNFADKIVGGFVRIYCENIFFGIGILENGTYRLKCMLGGNK